MNELDWHLRVPTLSIHPGMATMQDIARLAAELMEANHARLIIEAKLVRAEKVIKAMRDLNDQLGIPAEPYYAYKPRTASEVLIREQISRRIVLITDAMINLRTYLATYDTPTPTEPQ